MHIIALMMVKDEADIIEATLDNNEKFCDGAVILDNGSTDGTLDIIKAHPHVLKVVEDKGEFDERRLLKVLLKGAQETGADWYFELDADEQVSPLANGLKFMDLEPYNCVSFDMHYMLRQHELLPYRCYKIYHRWGRLYRNLGLVLMLDGCDKAVAQLHWGKNPIPKDERKYFHSGIAINHFQMRSYQQCMRKYNRYLEIDKNQIQGEGYEHFKQFAEMYRTGDFYGLKWID